MPVPNYEALMLPLLRLAGASRASDLPTAERLLADEFSLSDEDRSLRLPSCRIPDDCIDARRYPLFMARDVMRRAIDLIKAKTGWTPQIRCVLTGSQCHLGIRQRIKRMLRIFTLTVQRRSAHAALLVTATIVLTLTGCTHRTTVRFAHTIPKRTLEAAHRPALQHPRPLRLDDGDAL